MARMIAKVKMPEMPRKEAEAAEELDMDFPMDEEAMADAEADEDMGMEEPEAEEAASPLDEISDDELMAELKRRGIEMEDSEEADAEVEDEMEAEEIG